MKRELALWSFILLGISILFFMMLTFFESAFVGLPLQMERIITSLFLVVPAAIGVVLGGMSLARKEGRVWLAVAGMILNTLFALFHIMLLLFAG